MVIIRMQCFALYDISFYLIGTEIYARISQ